MIEVTFSDYNYGEFTEIMDSFFAARLKAAQYGWLIIRHRAI